MRKCSSNFLLICKKLMLFQLSTELWFLKVLMSRLVCSNVKFQPVIAVSMWPISYKVWSSLSFSRGGWKSIWTPWSLGSSKAANSTLLTEVSKWAASFEKVILPVVNQLPSYRKWCLPSHNTWIWKNSSRVVEVIKFLYPSRSNAVKSSPLLL